MTTGTIILPILGAILPDNSTGNKMPTYERVKSSAAAPSPHFAQLNFDPAVDQISHWQFRMPTDYSTGLEAILGWKANATSGDVVWAVFIAAITPGDTSTPNEKAFDAANDFSGTVNATEARRLVESSSSLLNADSIAAGDLVIVGVMRKGSDGGDTCTVNAELISVTIEYTGV